MALTILSSNRVETLQTRLTQQLSRPLRNPFASEVIVVPTYAMARWLNLSIAQQQGIAANIEYPLPAQWIWQLASNLIDEIPLQDPYSRESMQWGVFSSLPELISQPAFRSLNQYLDDDVNGVKRWQLAQRIADCFDRYQLYRADKIRSWTSVDEDHWQAILWRKISLKTGQPNRAETITGLIECLRSNSKFDLLPERISLFAISTLAPVFVDAIHALSRHTEITFYQHSPTTHYWADLKNQKTLSRLRLENTSQAEYTEVGNELLASWGRQGQVMQDLLLDRGISGTEIDHSHTPGNESLLKTIQQSIFELDDDRSRFSADHSLSLHICHSPMRECQVLHDHLLGMLERDGELTCEDILVMVPNISEYAVYIESVFQRDESACRPFLPWNISDITVEDNHPLAKSFLMLLKLPDSRFTFSEVMAYLDVSQVRERFGIDQSMLENIYPLMEKAGVRWGIDSRHRQSFELPALPGNTWMQAWQRLFAGYAIADAGQWQQIAAIDEIDQTSAIGIARLRHFFERLDHWRKQLSKPGSASWWQTRLNQLIDEFYLHRQEDQETLQSLRDAVDRLDIANTTELSPGLISYWLEQQLATSELPGRLFSGGVTFCGMRPMRNIPFKVICLLGMDDGVFPRRDSQTDFDVMSHSWRPGDPHKGDEDRYLMLETLLCARDSLYLSYCGRSLKDNSRRQSSVLVQELLDFIDTGFQAASNQRLSQAITVDHPMQPFANGNFSRDNAGYDRYWYETAKILNEQNNRQPAPLWDIRALTRTVKNPPIIELSQLRRFYRHPIQYFFNTRLGISLADEQLADDEEPFQLQGLQKWQVSQRLANALIDGESIDTEKLLGEGLLPHGPAAYSAVDAIRTTNKLLFDSLADFSDRSAENRSIDCVLDSSCRLLGEVDGYYPGYGLMQFTSSRLKGRNLLATWLDHLVLCASDSLAEDESSRLITAKQQLDFARISSANAKKLLVDYVSIFQLGADCPLPIFPDTSYAWCEGADSITAMTEARKTWSRSFAGAPPGENEDSYIRLALHNNIADPLQDPKFAEFAERIFAPLRDHLESA